MLFKIYVGNTLYLQTLSASKAFDLFGKWQKANRGVRMEFVQSLARKS